MVRAAGPVLETLQQEYHLHLFLMTFANQCEKPLIWNQITFLNWRAEGLCSRQVTGGESQAEGTVLGGRGRGQAWQTELRVAARSASVCTTL